MNLWEVCIPAVIVTAKILYTNTFSYLALYLFKPVGERVEKVEGIYVHIRYLVGREIRKCTRKSGFAGLS